MKKEKPQLSTYEKGIIKALNFLATLDGIISSEDDRRYMLEEGIRKGISKKNQHLLSITQTAYPMKIKIKR